MNNSLLALSAPVALVANRDFKLPADGWMQLFPFKNVTGPIENPDGTKVNVVQVLDAEAGHAVLSSFKAEAAKPNFGGVLVDFEHFSLDPTKESRGAMWIDELENRENGMFFKGRITNSGKTALEGGDYRYISPVLEFPIRNYKKGERVRPIGLHSAGLTNDPRIKGGLPISNRDGNHASATEQNKTTMKEVNKLLGLAEDASEGSAVAAIQLIVNRATKAEGSVTTITAERDTLLAAQVESDLETHKAVITNRDDMKAALLKDRTGTLKVLGALKKPVATDTSKITNRNAAQNPGAEGEGDDVDQKRTAKITNRANELKSAAPTRSFDSCWQQARNENAPAK